jgi:hypothetical protein
MAFLDVLTQQLDAGAASLQPFQVLGRDFWGCRSARDTLRLWLCAELKVGVTLGAAWLVAVDGPVVVEPRAEMDTDALALRRQLDPLEGVRVLAVLVDAAGGQLQAGAPRVRRDYALRAGLVEVAAEQQITFLVDQVTGIVALKFGEVVPGVMQDSDAPVDVFGQRGLHRLGKLIAAKEQTVAVLVAAGHPGGIQTGDMQPRASNLDHTLPPGQRLGFAVPAGDEIHVALVAPEHHAAFILVSN